MKADKEWRLPHHPGCGLVVYWVHVSNVERDIERARQEAYRDVVIKSNWLKMREKMKKYLQTQYGQRLAARW